jgi:ABC-type uncharacterized transport system YnjBCD substrate-binding protein
LPMNPNKLSYALPERITTGSTSSPIGLDDESRLGYHTASPVLWLPMNPNKLSYALPERITTGSTSSPIGLVQSKSLYYTNLNTAFNTAV